MLLTALPVVAQVSTPLAEGQEATGAAKAAPKKAPNLVTDAVWELIFKNPDHNYHTYRLTYQSIDGKKNPITLTATVYLDNYYSDINHILLSCHPTVTSCAEAPTGGIPVDGEIRRMCGEKGGWMVVCPDYCGYGISSYAQHPYLIHDVTARNCVDAVVAAVKKVKANDEWHCWGVVSTNDYNLKPGYSTDIVGYSQGGATALACAKYLESDACPNDIKTTVNLRRTTCGDGPYSMRATLEKYMEWGKPDGDNKSLEYPCVLPLIVAAAKDAYGDGCMSTVEVEDLLNPDFLEKTNIMNLLRSKVTTLSDINAAVYQAMGDNCRPVDLFSDKIINPDGTFNTTTNEYKCLQRVMDLAELTTGWTPQHKITFFHLEQDGVVPYKNYEAVLANFKDKTNIYVITPEQLADQWNLSDFSIATKIKHVCKEDYKKFEHSQGGMFFYVAYMLAMSHD